MKQSILAHGINIQWPWSQLILKGDKRIETRKYPIPPKFINQKMIIIETPGPEGKKNGVDKARAIGLVTFSHSFLYEDRKHWESDFKNHLVSSTDILFAYKNDQPKYGWVIDKVELLSKTQQVPSKRGHIYCSPFKVQL